MKREELINENFINMKEEYLVSHNNVCRRIDAIFRDELKRFQTILSEFNSQFKCIQDNQFYLINDNLKNIFNTFKVMLVDDYESRFNTNVDLLTNTMHDFFIRKLSNSNLKIPSKEINKYLNKMCKFDFFKVSNDLEDKLLTFMDDFIYKYVNSEDAKRDFEYKIKNVNYTIVCELKKAVAISIEDKQDITSRYNTLNKEVLNNEELIQEEKKLTR